MYVIWAGDNLFKSVYALEAVFLIRIAAYYAGKLITSETECIISSSYTVQNTLSYVAKDLITGLMTIGIVNRLEIIQI